MNRITRAVLALVALVVAVPVFAATFTVTSTADSGPGTLRQAIVDANATAGTDTIVFAIGSGPQTIAVLSALPVISQPLTIDAATQPGFTGNPIVELNGAAAAGATGLVIQANSVTIRGLVINRFPGSGIQTEGAGTTIATNWIGLGLDGTTDQGNGNFGVLCFSPCTDLQVGGSLASEGNVISGNGSSGVRTLNAGAAEITNNRIGTDSSGTVAVANNIGVSIDLSSNAVIEGNVISGNRRGVDIRLSNFVTVENNRIGVGSDGTTAIPNTTQGVLVEGNNNEISGNTIAYSSFQGVLVINAASGNTISGNNIYSNGLLGIDLGDDNVTPNDPNDGDSGPNALQNFPVIASATRMGPDVSIAGTLNSTPSTSFTIEFFANTNCATGAGEGALYRDAVTVTTDASGNASFTALVPVTSDYSAITATATNDSTGNTSEFSACASIAALPGSVSFSSATYLVDETAGSVTVTVTRSGDTSAPASVQYATSNVTATAGEDYASTSGTLNWAAGDAAPKTIVIPILNDADFEAPETFTVTLTNATGATLGATSTTTVTIVSEDLAAAAAAVPTASEWALLLLASTLGLLALRRL